MKALKNWLSTFFRSWLRRYRLVFGNVGVMIFFFGLPLAYPLIYSIIYNNELCRDIPMVVVDNSRTQASRELTRMYDASQYVKVVDYAPDLAAAKTMLKERKAYSILDIPEDYGKKLGRLEVGVFPLYSDMSLLYRYRNLLFATTEIQIQLGSDVRQNMIDNSVLAPAAPVLSEDSNNVKIEPHFIGDEVQGFASFIMIGVLVVILQQSLMLGVFMLSGSSMERRRRNNGIDPLAVGGPSSALVLGRAMCYFTIFVPLTVYVLHYVPLMFSLPHVGSALNYLLFMVPFVLASAFFAETLRRLVAEGESSMLVWVFTSVVILFISGLTWPRTAMNWLWESLSSLIPATWAIDGYIAINSNDATLSDVQHQYLMLWLLATVYFVTAVFVDRRIRRHPGRLMRPLPMG